jgi:hypothetical protein
MVVDHLSAMTNHHRTRAAGTPAAADALADRLERIAVGAHLTAREPILAADDGLDDALSALAYRTALKGSFRQVRGSGPVA